MTSLSASALEDDPHGCTLLKRVIASVSRRGRIKPSWTRTSPLPRRKRVSGAEGDRVIRATQATAPDELGAISPQAARAFSFNITACSPA